MRVLVTGGAGYIGSFAAKKLIDEGYDVVVFDNLERGNEKAVDTRAAFVKGDIKEHADLCNLFIKFNFDAIMHFAGLISVEESSKNPDLYYENNVIGSKNLFDAALEIGRIKKIIFSSTAAIYGNPITIPIPEDHPKNPVSNYGKTKLEIEQYLENLSNKYPRVDSISLRYFNACGAALDGSIGEDHNPETHIIPLAVKAALEGKEFYLFGNDYDTPDGTCIRDYIHVLDLVDAHMLSLKRLEEVSGAHFYNVGTGNGFSNREVISMVEKISGKKLNIGERARRSGDADRLIADPRKINSELGFSPKYSDLETIIKTAWQWHEKN